MTFVQRFHEYKRVECCAKERLFTLAAEVPLRPSHSRSRNQRPLLSASHSRKQSVADLKTVSLRPARPHRLSRMHKQESCPDKRTSKARGGAGFLTRKQAPPGEKKSSRASSLLSRKRPSGLSCWILRPTLNPQLSTLTPQPSTL